MAVKTQLNAAHAHLTISTLSEMRVFLKNHSTEFHKVWQQEISDSA